LALLIGIAIALLPGLLGLRLARLLVLLVLLPFLLILWVVSTLPLTGVRLIGVSHVGLPAPVRCEVIPALGDSWRGGRLTNTARLRR